MSEIFSWFPNSILTGDLCGSEGANFTAGGREVASATESV